MKPIIYSTSEIQAYLDDQKTMTILVIKPQPYIVAFSDTAPYKLTGKTVKRECETCHHPLPDSKELALISCPYGQVGSVMWVKETFVIESDMEYGYEEAELAQWAKDRPIKTMNGGWEYGEYHLIPHYRATEPEPNIVPDWVEDFDDRTRWTPSIFMPLWASRFTQTITELRAERLQLPLSSEELDKEGGLDALPFLEKINGQWVWVISYPKYSEEPTRR